MDAVAALRHIGAKARAKQVMATNMAFGMIGNAGLTIEDVERALELATSASKRADNVWAVTGPLPGKKSLVVVVFVGGDAMIIGIE